MKQIIQYQKTGEISIADLPKPCVKDGWVLVRNELSLISAGTERTSVETAQATMIGKAKSRPDLVKQVLDNAKKDGITATYEKVKNRLDNYKELGYSCAGTVIESKADGIKASDRVACGGLSANHSEFVVVPKNLTVKIPDGITFEEAAFTTLGSIAMQGVRQADLRVGENAAVIGLGLLGLITVQILKASGCKVIGLDVNEDNFEIAKRLGCNYTYMSNSESIKLVESFTNGYGADAVIITAGSKSNEPVELAMKYARKKGKVVVVGAVGMNIPRSPFYEKEIDFRISCSYGPGRYDLDYEEKGLDYPYGFVRWTERRNMECFLELVKSKKVDVKSLITQRIPIEEGLRAYDIITGKVKEKYVGVLISYCEALGKRQEGIGNRQEVLGNREEGVSLMSGFLPGTRRNDSGGVVKKVEKVVVGFIGAGNFAQSYLIPNLKGCELKTVVTGKGVNAVSACKKFGFEFSDTNVNKVFDDDKINSVFIASRHDSHGKYVAEALKKGKYVFVEKPLCIDDYQLSIINAQYMDSSLKFATANAKNAHAGMTDQDEARRGYLVVGFNRRFSKPFRDIKKFFSGMLEPMVITYRVNAGFIPMNHWTQDPAQGGRIIGEGCHFIDTMQFLTGAKPVNVYASELRTKNSQYEGQDNVSVVINFNDGSVGNLIYLANGDSGLEKEYCEVFCGSKIAIMNNFKSVEYYKGGKSRKSKYDGSKGHREEVKSFIDTITGKSDAEFSFESLYLTTLTTFKVIESLRSGEREKVIQ